MTILALGGLLMAALSQSGYPERFSVGLLTATGSWASSSRPACP